MAGEQDEQAVYNALFALLADEFRVDGWEARQEAPSQAYLHVSRPNWGDERMNGVHLEAYVLGGELESRRAPVALHCEAGCPFQARFMELFTERAASTIHSFPGAYTIHGPVGSSVCEISVPFGDSPTETVERLAEELRRLQSLATLIDSTIEACLGMETDSEGGTPTEAGMTTSTSTATHLLQISELAEAVGSIGVGTIWCGRQWPPKNPTYQPPSTQEIDAYLSNCLARLPGKRLLLDTASGYGDSERVLGHWLCRQRTALQGAASSRLVLCTKFGETYDLTGGETRVDLSAAAAERQLQRSLELLGRVDIFYSHITSQVTAAEAKSALADATLRKALVEMKRSGRVALLGTSCSHLEELQQAFQQGLLDHLDVVQVAARVVRDKDGRAFLAQLCSGGKLVVINSPIRHLKLNEIKGEEAVKTAVQVASKPLASGTVLKSTCIGSWSVC
jgi:aryl-alcohol dehydrogenase-like predicted oxidoreductase